MIVPPDPSIQGTAMRFWVLIAALNGLMAVALGAYAAHGLAADAYAQSLAERASQYQLVHALALLAADRLAADRRRLAHGAAAAFTLGIALFSGSLYLKALTGELAAPLVTPTGGMVIMLAWLALAGSALSRGRT